MGKGNFTEDFKLDAIKQITERGYPVLEVSQRLGCQHAFALRLDKAVRRFSRCCGEGRSAGRDKAAEARAGACHRGERDILKKATAYFAKDAK